MWNAIPIFGWIINFCINISYAVPFWFCWTYCSIGQMFTFLNPEFQIIEFWKVVGIFICLSIIKRFSPFSISSNSTFEKLIEKSEIKKKFRI